MLMSFVAFVGMHVLPMLILSSLVIFFSGCLLPPCRSPLRKYIWASTYFGHHTILATGLDWPSPSPSSPISPIIRFIVIVSHFIFDDIAGQNAASDTSPGVCLSFYTLGGGEMGRCVICRIVCVHCSCHNTESYINPLKRYDDKSHVLWAGRPAAAVIRVLALGPWCAAQNIQNRRRFYSHSTITNAGVAQNHITSRLLERWRQTTHIHDINSFPQLSIHSPSLSLYGGCRRRIQSDDNESLVDNITDGGMASRVMLGHDFCSLQIMCVCAFGGRRLIYDMTLVVKGASALHGSPNFGGAKCERHQRLLC